MKRKGRAPLSWGLSFEVGLPVLHPFLPGLLHIGLDRPKLEARVCECYAVVKREYGRLLPQITAT